METTEFNMRPRDLGFSMKTRNVQALADDQMKLTAGYLERYIRPEMHGDDMLSDNNTEEIPVIDTSRLIDESSREEEALKLKHACEDWGFFQLVKHGVPEEVIEGTKDNIKGFFDLPLEKREEVAQLPGDLEGYESYSRELHKVVHTIFGFTATNLGINSEKITEHFGLQTVCMNYYPPCAYAHDKVVGLSPHSDSGGLTLLLQVSPIAGLQIRRNEKWLPVMPLAGALVVNTGDSLEIFTNGRYKSIEHRAVINAKDERISIAAFHGVSFGRTVGPLADIVGDRSPLFKSLNTEEYAKLITSQKLDGKNRIELMKLNP